MTLRIVLGISLWIVAFVSVASAQKVVVDAVPSHAVNSFSPVRAMGAGVDRLRGEVTHRALTDPWLKEILSAGWQSVSYRQNAELHVEAWPDPQGGVSWLGRFLDYLKVHGRLNDLSFFTFEHYPYDPCNTSWNDLYREPERTDAFDFDCSGQRFAVPGSFVD